MNPWKKPHRSRNYHTSLADAIMTGNVEIVKKLLCRVSTKVMASSKEQCFGGCLVAVKYGQLGIFKILLQHSQEKSFDWQKLKD